MLFFLNKTPAIRRCPIFPELRPHLLRAREYAPEGAELVVTRYEADANILTTLEKIVIRTGLVPWPKLMQNLRATRETELLAHYPAKDVTNWLGNSPDVANKHYAMTMQASFDRAVVDGAKIVGVTTVPPNGAKPAANDDGEVAAENAAQKTPLNPPQTVQAKGRNPETQKKPMLENPTNDWACLASALGDLVTKLPRQDFPDMGIAGVFSSDDEDTTKSTTSASMFAECICKHLDDAQLAELLSRLEMRVQR